MYNDSMDLQDFQSFIKNVLIRNKSILDQTTKLQDACTHLCRTISKSATTCGCITIEAHKQQYTLSDELSIEELQNLLSTHINGTLCPNCEEMVKKEMGRILFYLGCIANTFDISLTEVMKQEKAHTELLGKYSLR